MKEEATTCGEGDKAEGKPHPRGWIWSNGGENLRILLLSSYWMFDFVEPAASYWRVLFVHVNECLCINNRTDTI